MLKKVKLAKAWNAHKKGSTVEVDLVRAQWLLEHDYDEDHPLRPALRIVKDKK